MLETAYSSLSKEVVSLRGQHGQSPSSANPTTNLSDPANVTTLLTAVASEQNSFTKPIPATPRGLEMDRKFNLVMYGLEESPRGTRKTLRGS